jgi:hypothetical protein
MKPNTALAVATGCTAAALLYSILRIVQAIVLPEPDPATVMWTEHSGFFWRAWTCAYAGGAVALIAHRFAGARVARALSRAILPVAAIVLLQAALVP